jgi:hypothetical protein
MEGSPKTACGFLAGLMIGSGRKGRIYLCQDEGVAAESLGERLAELVRLHPRDCEFIVDAATSRLLKSKAKQIEQTTGLKLSANRHIRSASLAFRFEAFGRRYGSDIRRLLRRLPAGARLEDYAEDEKVSPEAAGIEAYAPAHDYELRGSGRVVGRVDAVIAARRRLLRQPLLRLEPIQLNLA